MGLQTTSRIEVSTTIYLVRFLSTNLSEYISPLETCVLSLFVWLASHAFSGKHAIAVLSKRVSLLLLLEKIKPLLATHSDGNTLVRIHNIMVNAGLLSVLTIIPAEWRMEKNVIIISNAVVFMFATMYNFLANHREFHTPVFLIAMLTIRIKFVKKTRFLSLVQQVHNTAVSNLVITIYETHLESEPHAQILQLLMLVNLFEYVKKFQEMASLEDYFVFRVSGLLVARVSDDQVHWALVLLFLHLAMNETKLRTCVMSKILMLSAVDLGLVSVLEYIKRLAVHDTVVTLKTAALLLQFFLNWATKKFEK